MKAPAYQHFVKDWIADLSEHPLEIEGAWIAFCSRAWLSEDRGVLTKTLSQWAAIFRTDTSNALRVLTYIEEENIGDVTPGLRDMSHENHARVTVKSRRMVRDEKERKSSRLRKQKERERNTSRDCHGKVTPPSASATASATATAKKKDRGSLDPLVPESEKHPPCPHAEIQRLYHEILPELPRVNIWPEELQKILRTRWREDPERQDLSWWETYFRYVSVSDFLMGRVNEFQADLEWIIRPKNMTKVINGRYHKQNGKHVGIFEWLQRSEEVRCGTERQEAVCNGDGWTG